MVDKINFSSPLCDTSYGLVGSYFLSHLVDLGWDCHIQPLGPVQLEDRFARKFNGLSTELDDSPILRIFHQFALKDPSDKGPVIGFPIFELDGFAPKEVEHLSSVDHLIVPSKWAASLIKKHINRDAYVCPLGVDRSIFSDSPIPPPYKTIFLNAGKWEFRKGHDILRDAFNAAFTQTDPVELWMMPSNAWLSPTQIKEWENWYLNSKLGNKVKILPRVKTQSEVADIMRKVHCGVFPSRAEGWNLEALELLSCGRHVIASNVTAHTEYLEMRNAQLIDLTDQTMAVDGVFFNGQGCWYDWNQDNLDELVNHFQAIHNLNIENALPLNYDGIRTAEQFSWEQSTKTLDSILRRCIN